MLLQHIVLMYSNMSSEDIFLQHVVNDSRSFKSENFDKVIRIIGNPAKGVTVDSDSKEKFELMAVKIKSMRQELEEEDDLYEDAPEEFLDTLMSTLMKDPVELPSSRNILDYMTISKVSNYSLHVEKHLMNEQKDPFNRSPLTLDQLIPRKDIKEKIEAYKASKRQSRQ